MSQSNPIRPKLYLVLPLALSAAMLGACVKPPTPGEPGSIGVFGALSESELAAAQRDYQGPPPLEQAVVRSRFRKFDAGPLLAQLQGHPNRAVTLAPFSDLRLRLETTSFEDKGEGVYLWEARVRSTRFSRVSLAFNDDSMFGTIQVGQRIYEFMPVKSGVVLVNEYLQANFPLEANPRQATIIDGQYDAPADDYEETLGVLVVLPRPYEFLCGRFAFLPDFREVVAAAFESNLDAVFNAVRPTGVTADVSVECVNYRPVGGDLNADLDWVTTDDGIARLRDANDADLVSLLVPESRFCGRGWINYPITAAHDDTAFSVVVGSCALGNYSAAHELGHNVGMRHDRTTENAASSPDCNYGYFFPFEFRLPFFRFETEARTVMAYGDPCDGCERQGLYSNPTTLDFGFFRIGPMGVACDAPAVGGNYDRANNRQQLIDAAPVVSDFR